MRRTRRESRRRRGAAAGEPGDPPLVPQSDRSSTNARRLRRRLLRGGCCWCWGAATDAGGGEGEGADSSNAAAANATTVEKRTTTKKKKQKEEEEEEEGEEKRLTMSKERNKRSPLGADQRSGGSAAERSMRQQKKSEMRAKLNKELTSAAEASRRGDWRAAERFLRDAIRTVQPPPPFFFFFQKQHQSGVVELSALVDFEAWPWRKDSCRRRTYTLQPRRRLPCAPLFSFFPSFLPSVFPSKRPQPIATLFFSSLLVICFGTFLSERTASAGWGAPRKHWRSRRGARGGGNGQGDALRRPQDVDDGAATAAATVAEELNG